MKRNIYEKAYVIQMMFACTNQSWFEHVTACFGFDVVKGIIPKKIIFNSGRDVGEEVIRCVLSLFITMAHCHEQVRNVIKTTGGLQLSK